jgi:hypothetical protein
VDPAHASTSRAAAGTTAGLTPVPKHLDLLHARGLTGFRTCALKPVNSCVLVKGTGRKMLLFGDSHAWAMTPLFAAIARRENLNLFVSLDADCPWQHRLYTKFFFGGCRGWKEDLYNRVIPRLDPDIIVVMNVAFGSPGRYPSFVNAEKKGVGFGVVADATKSSFRALLSGGRDVVIIEPIPLPIPPNQDFQPLTCLASASVLEQCRYQARPTPTRLELLYRRIAKEDPNVRSLDLDKAVCPLFPTCDPIVNGQIVKWDPSHLTIPFAQSLAPQVDTYLKSVGILAPSSPRAAGSQPP